MLSKTDLTVPQNKAIDRLYDNDETMLIAPKGFGKCVVGYTAITELLDDEVVSKVLILSTTQVCQMTWAAESAKWDHLKDANQVLLSGKTIKQREKLLASNPSIIICNFELLPWLMDNYADYGFDGLLIDEITKMKNVGGVGFKKIRNKVKNFKWRVAMTADPVAQESMDIYGQMMMVDCGVRLGRNQEKFRRKFFMQMDYAGRKWDIQPGGLQRLTEALADITYKADGKKYEENLPELVDHEITIDLPFSLQSFYKDFCKTNILDYCDVLIEAPNEAVLQGKLHQICCGGIYYDISKTLDKEATFEEMQAFKGTERHFLFMHIRKMQAIRELRASIDSPLLIAYTFSFQKDALIEEFDAPVFSSSNSTKHNTALLERWNAGEIPELLIHPKSAGHGLNLQYGPCKDLVCMSYFWSNDEWEQLIGRLRRQGQESEVVNRWTIACKDTLEDIVMKQRLLDRSSSSEEFHKYLKSIK